MSTCSGFSGRCQTAVCQAATTLSLEDALAIMLRFFQKSQKVNYLSKLSREMFSDTSPLAVVAKSYVIFNPALSIEFSTEKMIVNASQEGNPCTEWMSDMWG
jgi:hypothetical protein